MMELSTNPPTPTHPAFERLQEFQSDPVAAGVRVAKEVRMKEMDDWAQGIGAHTERRAADHHSISQEIAKSALTGVLDAENAERTLLDVPTRRTGVRVNKDGSIDVHDAYPYSGDTPAGGWHTYRSPANIKK